MLDVSDQLLIQTHQQSKIRTRTFQKSALEKSALEKSDIVDGAELTGDTEPKCKCVDVRSKCKKCRSQCFDTTFTIIVVIIVRIIFTCSFFFECVLSNHTFQTNPDSNTNLSKLFNYIAPASLWYTFY